MTAEEAVLAALSQVADFTDVSPPRTVLYRRLSVRQQQLFSEVANWNADFFGVCAIGEIINGECNLRDLISGDATPPPGGVVPQPVLRFDRIEISDSGTSGYPNGQEVNVVTLNDSEGATLPPRATIRSGVLKQVGAELMGVAALEFYYSRRPLPVASGGQELEIPEPFDQLLVFDLAKYLVGYAPSGVVAEASESLLAILGAQETELLGEFRAYVTSFTPRKSRFADVMG